MSGDGERYHTTSSGSSTRRSSEKRSLSSKPDSRSRTSSDIDSSGFSKIYYPCFGKVDLKSYIAARTYGLNFRRLHDEWVVLGRPTIDTSHWPGLDGHKGLPSSPEDFIAVAEHYEHKIFSQVALDMEGKPADRDRPMDDFIISMVMTAAIVNADFLVHRLVRDQVIREEATSQHVWHRYFITFLQDSIRHFAKERTVCDRLGPHNCVVPLLYGQACSMSLPILLQTFDFQVQIFQNLFPNFGEHVSRCAAAQPSRQLGDVDAVIGEYIRKIGAVPDQTSPATQSMPISRPAEGSRTTHGSYAGSNMADDASEAQTNRPLAVTVVPNEVQGRPDLFVSEIDTTIRCDVPLEEVLNVIDSSIHSAASSTASTPPSIAALTSTPAPRHGSGVSSRASFPPSEAEWPLRRRGEASESAVEDGDADIDSTNLTLRPPLHTQGVWSTGVARRSTSEERNAVTPDEAFAAMQRRAQSSSVYSYFSSLPNTPTELLSPDGILTTQDGSQSYVDRRPMRSNSGVLPMTSTLESDTRKRTRAEQNREKMKAYHRRVMQQREALTSVLSDMSAHVGTIPMLSARTSAAGLMGFFPGEASGSMITDDVASGTGTSSSVGRSAPESSWSVSLRNKQKQESKARLRKREIDQVHELGLYANYARAMLSRSGAAAASAPPGASLGAFRSGGSATGMGDFHGGTPTAWRQPEAPQMVEADLQMSHAILRVFLRHRPSWVALISAEQRLAGEVAKLSPRSEDSPGMRMDDRTASDDGSASSVGKGIKALIDRMQLEERAGTLVVLSPEPAHMLSRGIVPNTGMGMQGALLEPTTAQRYAGQGAYGSALLMESGAVMLSPGREYGTRASPSGVTRPMGPDESTDYFSQERRQFGGRANEGMASGASAMSLAMTGSYSPEHAQPQLARGGAPGGAQRATGAGYGTTPSVLSAQSGFGYGSYAGEPQTRSSAQDLQRQAQAAMGGVAAMSPPAHPTQSRMSVGYDGRGYGGGVLHGAGSSRLEQAPSMYHAHPVPMQQYAYSQAASQGGANLGVQTQMQASQGLVQHGMQPTTDSMMTFRSNESAASSYPVGQPQQQQQQQQHQQQQQQQHHQHSSYSQHGGYSTQQ